MRKDCGSYGGNDGAFERIVTLPLGYVDDSGRAHRAARLRSITGQEQQMLNSVSTATGAAAITTQLLARCLLSVGEICEVDAGLVRRLLVPDREFLLLALYRMTFTEQLHVRLRCSVDACGEVTEVPLDLGAFTVDANAVEAQRFSLALDCGRGKTVEFRLPTGADQEAVAESGCRTEEEQVDLILTRLLLGGTEAVGELSAREREEIEQQIHRLSPGIEVELDATCPKCGNGFSCEIDVPFLVLHEIKMSGAGLDLDVHGLAFHYHWAESEIISLTPRRRARYMELIEEELERMVS